MVAVSTVRDRTSRRHWDPQTPDPVISVFVAFNFALAQPLLDLLGRNPEFFIASHSRPVDVFALVVALTLLVPLALGLAVRLVSHGSRPAGAVLHAVLLGTLVAAFALPLLRRVPLGVPAHLLVAAVAGGAAVLAHRTRPGVRTAVRFALPAPLVFATLFLVFSPVARIAFPDGILGSQRTVARSVPVQVGNPAPVVMVVFDEFPVASLLDPRGRIDAALFPNLARFAGHATWLRNATTVADTTRYAVPAMLTGRNPRQDLLPIVRDHPDNLFTTLADTYEVRAVEVMQLCPPQECTSGRGGALPARLRALTADLRIIALHALLPESLTASLPRLDQGWANFAGQGAPKLRRDGEAVIASDERATRFDEFLRDLRPGAGPTLHFLHVMLPHTPWRYLPTGQQYSLSRVPGQAQDAWGPDPWPPAQAYQRHLVQVQFVDRMIGRLVDRLERSGLYDDALVVLTADHGISFRPGTPRRLVSRGNVGEVAAVPLLLKRPGQRVGEISDAPVEGVDVWPTIADVLEVPVLPGLDGQSALSGGGPVRQHKTVWPLRGARLTFPADGDEKFAAARRKNALFASTGGAQRLYRLGEYGELVGRSVGELAGTPQMGATALVYDRQDYEEVDPGATLLPTMVRGEMRTDGSALPRDVAIAVNGRVEAVTRTYRSPDGTQRFGALVSPASLVAGSNTVQVFTLDSGPSGPQLHLLQDA